MAQLLVVGQRQNLLYPLGTDSYNGYGKTTASFPPIQYLPFLELTYMSVVSGTPGAGLNPGGMRGNRALIKLVFEIKEESKV